MFGYELADILLFDLETLKESYAGYLRDFRLVFYLGLSVNLFCICYLKKSVGVVCVLVALCWIFPGYYFFVREFEAIFWPSTYFGYLAIGMGLMQIYIASRGHSARQYSGMMALQTMPVARLQLAFAAATLLPALLTYFFSPDIVMALGTSVTVAALATLSLYLFQKGWLARTVSAVSVVWCLAMAMVLWALVYRV